MEQKFLKWRFELQVPILLVVFLLLFFGFVFLPSSAHAQDYGSAINIDHLLIDVTQEATGADMTVFFNSPIPGCTGAGFGSSQVQYRFWDGTSWQAGQNSNGSCSSGDFHISSPFGPSSSASFGTGWYALFFTDIASGDVFYFSWYLDGVPVLPESVTRILDVFPPDDYPDFLNPVATSTTFTIGGDIFVNSDDFVDGMLFRQTVKNNVSSAIQAVGPSFSEGGNLICSMLPNWLCPTLPAEQDSYTISGSFQEVFTYPIENDGTSSFSTTTDIQQIGVYTLNSEIIRPQTIFGISIPGTGVLYARDLSQFMVATSSSYDLIVGETIRAIQDMGLASQADCTFDLFTPSNYYPALVSCITALMQPAYDEIVTQIQLSMAKFLSHAPWGYGMRVYTILTDQDIATTSLPSLDFDFNPVGYDLEIDLTPWPHLMCPGGFLLTHQLPDGQNFASDILIPGLNKLLGVAWILGLTTFFFLRIRGKNNDCDD